MNRPEQPTIQLKCIKKHGFTLLEMLVALGIFAVIGMISAQILIQVIDLKQNTEIRSERLMEMQRATEIIRRDIQQLAYRSVRDEYGNPGPTVEINQTNFIQLTRRGWQNPLGFTRSELQRVSYQWEDKKIYRIFWNVLDRGNETEPVLQTLLDNVTMFEINAIDLYGERHRFWPVNSDTEESFKNNLAAIEVKFTVPPHGEITRLWSVPLRMENESDPPRA